MGIFVQTETAVKKARGTSLAERQAEMRARAERMKRALRESMRLKKIDGASRVQEKKGLATPARVFELPS